MNYQEAENYILSFSNLAKSDYMKDPAHCGVYLERLSYFLKLLYSPEYKIPHYIHVTGTSGKGSTVAFIREILLANGESVGSISSPHPTYINERWWVNGQVMKKKEFSEMVTKIKPVVDRYLSSGKYEMLSFFELTEAIGFYYLAKKKVKWAVLEVGCGGRFDSSNVIPYKDVAIITNIGLDHTEIFGNSKIKIAYEKAGIIKKDNLVFTSEKDLGCLEVIKKECLANQVELQLINNLNYKTTASSIFQTNFKYQDDNFEIKLLGEHQIKNAILAIEVAKKIGINIRDIKRGIKKAFHPLSLEVVNTSPVVILDGAHNSDKVKSTVKAIKNIFELKKIDLVVGFSANKNVRQMVSSLLALNLGNIAITRNTMNHFKKVADLNFIKKEFEKSGSNKNIRIFADPEDALTWILKVNKKNIKLVTGSIFLSGELRGKIKKRLLLENK